MSGDYCYIVLDNGKPVTGGTKKYHILNWWIKNKNFPERLRDFKAGRYTLWRLSPWREPVDITQEILNEISSPCT